MTWIGAWFWQKFWDAYGAVDALPDGCPLGFLTMFISALVLMPVILFSTLRMVWSLARVGTARKSMSSFFIVVLGIPLYPILAALLLALFFLAIRILALAVVVIGPMALVGLAFWQLMVFQDHFIEEQNELRDENGGVQDIGCCSMILGMIFGVGSLVTLGLVTCCCNILKFPVIFLSLFFHLWHVAVCSWLHLVQCPLGCQDSGSDSDSESSSDCCWWWLWFPIILAAWLVTIMLFFPCVFLLGFCIFLVVQLLAFAIWPAYVTAGWLRYAGPQGGRRRHGSACSAMSQGVRASYQLMWANDVVTNLFPEAECNLTMSELLNYMGEQSGTVYRCRKLSLLPPLTIGLTDSWDFAAQEIARQLGIGANQVEEAWNSLARQMIRLGREAIEDGWITRDWVLEIPVELCIGLPARTILDTVERSRNSGEIVLSSGLKLSMEDRPRGNQIFEEIWNNLMAAREARAQIKLTDAERECLCAMLLAGGGDADQLPPGLSAILDRCEASLGSKHAACQDVVRPLIAISILCSKQHVFKEKLRVIIEGITSDDAEDYLKVIRRHSTADALDLEGSEAGSNDSPSSESTV